MTLDLTLHCYVVISENHGFDSRFATLKGAASHALYLGHGHWVENGKQVWNYAQCEQAMRERATA